MESPVIGKQNRSLVRRIKVRNYKSIGHCSVKLGMLSILVGRNGAGKSNFLDALRFVSDSLVTSLDHAIKSRGGIDAVRRRSTGHPRNFSIEIEFLQRDWNVVTFGFEISAQKKGTFSVKRERIMVRDPKGIRRAWYMVEDGSITNSSNENLPPVINDRLLLVTAAGLPEFRPAYDSLISMGFYNLNPDSMKELQSPDAGELMHRDGSNIASVVARLESTQPHIMNRVRQYLQSIVPGILQVERVSLGPKETLQFRQRVTGSEHPWKFYATSISDGTLRSFGILVAVTQLVEKTKPVMLVGIEEPETALHPAAAGSLMDALKEASSQTQIIVTTHSADLLDQIDLENQKVLGVVSKENDTAIGQLDSASTHSIREHLYSAGELLRMDQLGVDWADVAKQQQIKLFS